MSTSTTDVAAAPAAQSPPRAEVLRRAEGIELIGEFEGSGFKEPPHLARRMDGQVVQLSELLYAVAVAADGTRDAEQIAAHVSEHAGRPVSAENVHYVADKKLRPLGVLALADGSTPELPKRPPIMALRARKPLLPERVVNFGARAFTWLHIPIVAIVMLLAIGVFDLWLFFVHGVAGGMRSALYNPLLLLMVLGSTIVATIFHEFGHASACRYGGARPGVMGVGLYLVWPAFYCDVTDAYRLNRAGRLRTDLGGVYFNAIFALGAGAVYFATGEEAALLAAVLQHVIISQQLLPLLRFDGYYVMTDLTGVPDILSRIKPIFRSLVRGRKREPRVAELKSWVRVLVTVYLAALIPTLAFLFSSIVMSSPRLIATAYDSMGLQIDRLQGTAGPAEIGLGVFRICALLLPIAGTTLSISRVSKMLGRGVVRWSAASMPRKVVAVVGTAALLGSLGYILLPNGDYQPIRPGERGTLGEAFKAMPDALGGRPSFTPERAALYAPEPTERQAEAAQRERRQGARPGDERRREALSQKHARGAPGEEGTGTEDDTGESTLGPDPTGVTGDRQSDPSGTMTQPGAGTQTSPSTGTTTTGTPPPTTDTTPTTTETTPTSTDTAPTTTETAPTTTDTTPTTTETAPTTTDTSPTTSDTTPTPTTPTTTDTTPTTTDTTTTTTAP